MPVGAQNIPPLQTIPGVRLGVAEANIKYPNRKDLVVMEIAAGSNLAAVFTQNRFCASPVALAKEHLAVMDFGQPSYLLINTGYANVGLGKAGDETALACCEHLAQSVANSPQQVLPFSTGVIGEALPLEKVIGGIPKCLESLSDTNWLAAAEGIMTTDTRPKLASKQFDYKGQTFSITGMSKGAGMIKPNMATMLAYVATDLSIPQPLLQSLLSKASNQSFNRITVDSDTSTNDSFILIATGKSELSIDSEEAELFSVFEQALNELSLELAHAIIKDGEGVTKFVEVKVRGARNQKECDEVAYTVAHSPLVKTALFASDPNWGRILAAVGRAEIESLDIAKVQIALGDVAIVENGERADSYTEDRGAAVMSQEEILIHINLGQGSVSTSIWTTDFSYDYVKINAEYRS